jgi:hypothetical protein
VLNRATAPADLGPVVASPTLHRVAILAKGAFVVAMIGYFVWDSNRAYKDQLSHFPPDPVPPYGRYEVASILVDDQDVEPATVREFRWKVVNLQEQSIGFRSSDGSSANFPIVSTGHNRWNILAGGADSVKSKMSDPLGWVAFSSSGLMEGVMFGRRFEVVLNPKNKQDFNLTSRGFRWVSEGPFFR